jgi:hypothetical protein
MTPSENVSLVTGALLQLMEQRSTAAKNTKDQHTKLSNASCSDKALSRHIRLNTYENQSNVTTMKMMKMDMLALAYRGLLVAVVVVVVDAHEYMDGALFSRKFRNEHQRRVHVFGEWRDAIDSERKHPTHQVPTDGRRLAPFDPTHVLDPVGVRGHAEL